MPNVVINGVTYTSIREGITAGSGTPSAGVYWCQPPYGTQPFCSGADYDETVIKFPAVGTFGTKRMHPNGISMIHVELIIVDTNANVGTKFTSLKTLVEQLARYTITLQDSVARVGCKINGEVRKIGQHSFAGKVGVVAAMDFRQMGA